MRISDWSSDVCSSDLAGGCSWRLVRVPEQVSQEALRGDHVAAQLDLRLKVVLADVVDHEIGRKGCETLCLYPEVIDHVMTRLAHFQAEIGRAHVRTTDTHAHIVCRLLPAKNKT